IRCFHVTGVQTCALPLFTIAGALEAEPLLAERLAKEDEVKTLLGLAQKLEGLTRNVGMHAGGVLIAPGKLTDFTPLYQQPGSEESGRASWRERVGRLRRE